MHCIQFQPYRPRVSYLAAGLHTHLLLVADLFTSSN